MFKLLNKYYTKLCKIKALTSQIIQYYGTCRPINDIELQYLFNYQNRNNDIFEYAIKNAKKFWSNYEIN
jgi:hypothetical protein